MLLVISVDGMNDVVIELLELKVALGVDLVLVADDEMVIGGRLVGGEGRRRVVELGIEGCVGMAVVVLSSVSNSVVGSVKKSTVLSSSVVAGKVVMAVGASVSLLGNVIGRRGVVEVVLADRVVLVNVGLKWSPSSRVAGKWVVKAVSFSSGSSDRGWIQNVVVVSP